MKDKTLAWACALIIPCALLASLPLYTNGPSCGHDFDFHLQSWFAANSAWHGWLLNPHWVAAANYGAGEPRFVFYPPLSWALGALLGSTLPWTLVPQTLTFFALLASGMAMYTLARQWVSEPLAAATACVYLANPYLLFIAYERAAYGELLGAISMPLVVLYALRPRPAIIRLALVVAVLWFTNAPAAVMGCYLLLLCGMLTTAYERSILPSARSLLALALGTGVAGVYVLPAWYEQRWVEIARVVGPGMRVEDSFLFGHTGEPFHDQVLHTASVIAVTVLAAGLLFAAVSFPAQPRRDPAELPLEPASSPLALPVALVASALLAILFLLLPASEPVWRFAPELHFLQFPWRWLLVASLAAALSGALAAESIARRRHRPLPAGALKSVLTMILAAIALIVCTGAGRYAQHTWAQSCDEEDNVHAQQSLLLPPAPVDTADTGAAAQRAQLPGAEAPVGFEGTDEYTPSGADNGEIQQGLPAVRLLPDPADDEGDDSASPNPAWKVHPASPGSIRISLWAPEHKLLTVDAAVDCYAVLRLLDYPAWQVRLNDRLLALRPRREDGLLTLPLRAGTTRIEISYQPTPDVFAGRAVSLLSLATLAGIGAWTRRRPRPLRRLV